MHSEVLSNPEVLKKYSIVIMNILLNCLFKAGKVHTLNVTTFNRFFFQFVYHFVYFKQFK